MKNWFKLLNSPNPISAAIMPKLAAFLQKKTGTGMMPRPAQINKTSDHIKARHPALKKQILKDAAKALALKAALFGFDYDLKAIASRHGLKGRCGLIPWHHELKTGYGFYPDPVTLELSVNTEAQDLEKKFMLDLPRLQWCTALGEAYALTGQEKYTRMFVNILTDFFAFVPPRAGFPWANAMDTGIRLCNMVLLWGFFRNSPALTDEFIVSFWRSIIDHMRECLRHAEDWAIEPPHPMAELPHIKKVIDGGGTFRLLANHYLGGRIGVWTALQTLPDSPMTMDLKSRIQREMEDELLHQILPEGMDFEASTQYHRLVTEMFICWALVNRNKKIPMSDNALNRFKGLFETTRDLTRPDGLIPQIGDHDNGRIHIFEYNHWQDIRYVTTLGAYLLKDRSLIAPGTPLTRYALWQCGPAAERYTDPAGKILLPSTVYKDTGLAMLRNGGSYATLAALDNGQDGAGGHAHDDKLSVTWSIGKKNILIDPGLGVYVSDYTLRKFFRSIRNHSVLAIDNKDINPICPGYPWFVPDNAEAEITAIDIMNHAVTGTHCGFADLGGAGKYARTIQLKDDGSLFIKDQVPGTKRHTLTWRFVLAPGLEAAFRSKKHMVIIHDKKNPQAILRFPADAGITLRRERGMFAPEYGRWEPIRIVALETRRTLPRSIEFTLTPAGG